MTKIPKNDQSWQERGEIEQNLLAKMRDLLADVPVEVIGNISSTSICCRNGTVALVEIDADKLTQ